MMLWHRKYHRFTFYNRRTGTGNVLPCPCPCPENGFKKHLFRLFTSDLETRDPRAPCLGLASAGFTLVFQIAQNITTCLFIQHRCCVDDDGQCCIWGHHQITQCPAQPPASGFIFTVPGYSRHSEDLGPEFSSADATFKRFEKNQCRFVASMSVHAYLHIILFWFRIWMT